MSYLCLLASSGVQVTWALAAGLWRISPVPAGCSRGQTGGERGGDCRVLAGGGPVGHRSTGVRWAAPLTEAVGRVQTDITFLAGVLDNVL